MKLLWLLLIATLPCQAAMTVSRELIAPEHVAPGQPVRIAVTFWTDSWFNPPPQWPDFPVENGALLTTTEPNQLLTRHEGGTSWSGIRMERQATAWDQGQLHIPAFELTLTGAGQAPVTVKLPALDKAVSWPDDVQQPDHFLPAASLALSQKITLFHRGDDGQLRAGAVIERVVTVVADDAVATQIPPLLYAIPGMHTQRLSPQNTLVTSGRGDIHGAQRVETLRYLPVEAGTVALPPIKLRWWDTTHQQWKTAELPGSEYKIAPAPNAGAEAALKGQAPTSWGLLSLWVAVLAATVALLFMFRRTLSQSARYVYHQWHRFWHPTSLPDLVPEKRSSR